MAEPTSILVVDDDEGLLILIADTLRTEGYVVTTAASAAAAAEQLAAEPAPTLMVLDLKLQDASGLELVKHLQAVRPVPFIVVTGQGDEKVAVEVMKQGALDYVIKDFRLLDVLPVVTQRAIASIAQKNALIAAQAEHRRLEREILAAGERERHSIGADLHDNLGQQLTALELICTTVKEDAQGQPGLARRLNLMSKMLREAISQTRFLARGLVPVGSEPDALQIGLTELADRTNALGRIQCRFESPVPIALPDPFISGHLYRIAQEAVNNAIKHAQARQVTIRLLRDDEVLKLEIQDDGAGLQREGGPRSSGLGLGVMKHRASVIGGTLSIASTRGEGVTIACTLPFPR